MPRSSGSPGEASRTLPRPTDEKPQRLREFPWVRVLTNPSNLGFVRGNNAGIRAAAAGSDVLLLNNDVEILQPGWVDRLREAAHASPDVGVVGCRLVLPDGPARRRRGRGEIDLGADGGTHRRAAAGDRLA